MTETDHSGLSRFTAGESDRWAILLSGLFITVLSGSVLIATSLANLGVEPAMSGSSSSEQAAAGAGWALLEVLVAVVLLTLVLLYNRLPEWAQDTVKTGVMLVAGMWVGVVASGVNAFIVVAIGGVVYVGIHNATDAYDVYWLWNNIEALVLAIVLGGVLGVVLPLPFLIVGLVGLTVYDHYFANENDYMFTLGSEMLRAKLPVVVFAFPRLRVGWDDIVAALEPDADPEDDRVTRVFESRSGFGIGMADLLLPAAVASAVAVAGGGVGLPVLGIMAGVVVAAFRLRWEMINVGGGAGLPAITTGTLGGYAMAGLLVVIIG